MGTSDEATSTPQGGCTCRHVRYQISGRPLFVNCCHCRWCQRETGSAFVVNALYEADRVQLLAGEVRVIDTPTHSGNGQRITRCPKCQVSLWSTYAGVGEGMRFVRIGTLDAPDEHTPQAHIFISSKQPWVQLPAGVPAFSKFYKPAELWPAQSLERYRELLARAPRAPD